MRSIDYLIDRIWDELALVKIYTKKRGAHPDLSDPICLRKGATIEVCIYILYARPRMQMQTDYFGRTCVTEFIVPWRRTSVMLWSGESRVSSHHTHRRSVSRTKCRTKMSFPVEFPPMVLGVSAAHNLLTTQLQSSQNKQIRAVVSTSMYYQIMNITKSLRVQI